LFRYSLKLSAAFGDQRHSLDEASLLRSVQGRYLCGTWSHKTTNGDPMTPSRTQVKCRAPQALNFMGLGYIGHLRGAADIGGLEIVRHHYLHPPPKLLYKSTEATNNALLPVITSNSASSTPFWAVITSK